MTDPRLILCSGACIAEDAPIREGRRILELSSIGSDPNVHIRLEDVARVFTEDMTPRLLDFLEIAAYVYSADCAVSRGRRWTDEGTTESWDRDFCFIIPVRDPDFWRKPDILAKLLQILSFLSNDKYQFEFEQLTNEQPRQGYLQFGDVDWPFHGVDRVLMFSGGLDSLAGAVEMAANNEKLVLVSHRPVATLYSRQKALFQKLEARYPGQIIHVPVMLNKHRLDDEPSQRTRSFLFAALGTIVAQSVKAKGIRFFENGILSLNLPLAEEALRARASRTTHPLALSRLAEFCSLVVGHDLAIDNPFIFKTKTEVLASLAQHDAAHLIEFTCSCAHIGFFQSSSQWHCGVCSQCIDRRTAILAAGLEASDPETGYKVDVFRGPRSGLDKNIAVGYVRHALELHNMGDDEIITRFNHYFLRAARPFPNQREAVDQFVAMERRHASTVNSVLEGQWSKNASDFLNGHIPENSLLGIIQSRKHLEPDWKRYCDELYDLLAKGVPAICRPPGYVENEPRLQEICDGILKGHDSKLAREYPFLRWGPVKTKPDWSAEPLLVLIELKYIRKKQDIMQVSRAIAEDITKYGGNEKRVMFIVYDPHHLIVDDDEFAEPIGKRDEMIIRFLR